MVGRLDCFIELIESYFKLYFLWSRFRLNWGAQSEVTEWRKNVIFWKKKKKNFDFWFFFWEKCFEVSITISSTKIIRNFFGCGRKLFKITLQKDFLKKKKVTRTAGVKEFQNEKKENKDPFFQLESKLNWEVVSVRFICLRTRREKMENFPRSFVFFSSRSWGNVIEAEIFSV